MPVLLYHLLPEIRREANSPLARQALRQRKITTLLEHPVFGEIKGAEDHGLERYVSTSFSSDAIPPFF